MHIYWYVSCSLHYFKSCLEPKSRLPIPEYYGYHCKINAATKIFLQRLQLRFWKLRWNVLLRTQYNYKWRMERLDKYVCRVEKGSGRSVQMKRPLGISMKSISCILLLTCYQCYTQFNNSFGCYNQYLWILKINIQLWKKCIFYIFVNLSMLYIICRHLYCIYEL